VRRNRASESHSPKPKKAGAGLAWESMAAEVVGRPGNCEAGMAMKLLTIDEMKEATQSLHFQLRVRDLLFPAGISPNVGGT
jgi:hypothetical protein